MGLSLGGFSSRSGLRFRLCFQLSSLTWVSGTSRLLTCVYPACSVRPTVRTFAFCQCSRARHVALYPATFQRLTRYSLSSSELLRFSLSLLLCLSLSFCLPLSFFLTRMQSFYLVLKIPPSYSSGFFLPLNSCQSNTFFRIFASYTLLVSYLICIGSIWI